MDDLGLEYLNGTAAFYFFVSIKDSALTSEEFCDRLLCERKVCVVPGIGYGESCDDFVSVSVGNREYGTSAGRYPGPQGSDRSHEKIEACANIGEHGSGELVVGSTKPHHHVCPVRSPESVS